jgi:site-specific DNA recombinase
VLFLHSPRRADAVIAEFRGLVRCIPALEDRFEPSGSINYHLLNNRIYIGEIVHQGNSHPGLHEAIIPRELWNKVAARLEENNRAHRVGASQSTTSLLAGKLFDSNGARFTPTHAVKNAKRYRYYTSQTVIRKCGVRPATARFAAQGLEQFVRLQIQLLLQTPARCVAGMQNSPSKGAAVEKAKDLAMRWPELEASRQHEFVRNVLRRVTVGQKAVWIEIDRIRLIAALLEQRPRRPSSSVRAWIQHLKSDSRVSGSSTERPNPYDSPSRQPKHSR